MVIFFIILLILIAIATILITYSTLRVDIKELIVINKKLEKFKVIISLNLLDKIKWLKLRLDNKRVDKIRGSAKLKTFNKILDTKLLRKNNNVRQTLIKAWKYTIKNLNKFEIESVRIESKLGTENVATTAISTGIISAILGIILARKTSNPKYKIEPIYINKNYLYLSINCIITVKLGHIISMNRKLWKGVYQKYGGKSNTRTYADSNG